MTSESSATRTAGGVMRPATRSEPRRPAAAAGRPGAPPRPAATAGRRGARPPPPGPARCRRPRRPAQPDAGGAVVQDQHLVRLAAAEGRYHGDGVAVAVQQAGHARPWVGEGQQAPRPQDPLDPFEGDGPVLAPGAERHHRGHGRPSLARSTPASSSAAHPSSPAWTAARSHRSSAARAAAYARRAPRRSWTAPRATPSRNQATGWSGSRNTDLRNAATAPAWSPWCAATSPAAAISAAVGPAPGSPGALEPDPPVPGPPVGERSRPVSWASPVAHSPPGPSNPGLPEPSSGTTRRAWAGPSRWTRRRRVGARTASE